MGHIARIAFGFVFTLLYYGVLLFGPAGTLHWPRAWIFIGTILAGFAFMVVTVFNRDPGLLKERYRSPFEGDQPGVDKLVLLTLIGSYTAQQALIARDVFHWHLLPQPSFLASSLGLLGVIECYVMFYFTFRENSFASPVVRLQEERHQRVIDSGPYAFVRHPLYVGALGLFMGAPLWLGSTAGLLFSVIPLACLVVRIGIEESFLRQNLPGYTEYANRVRYRLFPGIW